MSMPIDLEDVTPWCTNTSQWVRGSEQQIVSKRQVGILGMSACMETGAPKIIMIFLILLDILQLESHIGQLCLNLAHFDHRFSYW